MKRLEKDEIERLLPHMHPSARVVAEFLGRTGARVSEALMVKRQDVDLERGKVRIPTLKRRKWRSCRELPIGAEYAKQLVEGRGDGRLFRVSRQWVWQEMRRAALKAGVDSARAHPHAIRHGWAIANVMAGVPIPVLRRWLGHRSLNSTLVYCEEVDMEKWTPKGVVG